MNYQVGRIIMAAVALVAIRTMGEEWNKLSLPITEEIHAQELSMPISQVITQHEVIEIVERLNKFGK